MKLFRYLILGISVLSIGWITPGNVTNSLVASRDIIPASSDTHDVGTSDDILKGGYFRFLDLKETGRPETPVASQPYIFASTDGHVYSRSVTGTSRQLGTDTGTVLLHFNDSFLDSASSDRIFVSADNANVTTSEYKFGGGSLALDGTGDYLYTGDSPDVNFGTGYFTIDAWVRTTSLSVDREILRQYVDNNNTWVLYINTLGALGLWVTQGGVAIANYVSPVGKISINNWYHVALVRYGTIIKLFVNGVDVTPTSPTASIGTASMPDFNADILIGGRTTQTFSGNIDELRISKGIARITSDFTPPTKEY